MSLAGPAPTIARRGARAAGMDTALVWGWNVSAWQAGGGRTAQPRARLGPSVWTDPRSGAVLGRIKPGQGCWTQATARYAGPARFRPGAGRRRMRGVHCAGPARISRCWVRRMRACACRVVLGRSRLGEAWWTGGTARFVGPGLISQAKACPLQPTVRCVWRDLSSLCRGLCRGRAARCASRARTRLDQGRRRQRTARCADQRRIRRASGWATGGTAHRAQEGPTRLGRA
mmetsp:Transcript_41616/g.86954  ORF Transcript_41616/g.86954 Transcript_41616/m.86954 type:complete len:230 (+) Transcript_41616:518-1207(+)